MIECVSSYDCMRECECVSCVASTVNAQKTGWAVLKTAAGGGQGSSGGFL